MILQDVTGERNNAPPDALGRKQGKEHAMKFEPGKMAFGMAIGVGLGAAIGTAMDNLPIGIAIGIALGAAASGFYRG